jgi:hypothetical protein
LFLAENGTTQCPIAFELKPSLSNFEDKILGLKAVIRIEEH